MSIYSSGVAAYRDTTKWLTAFVPVTALTTAAVVAGPALLRSLQSASSPLSWLRDHWLVIVCAVVLFAGMAAILACGARVLSVEPVDVGELVSGSDGQKVVAGAIGSGATVPYFFDKTAFDAAMSSLANAWDDKDNPVPPDDPRAARLLPAVEALREWSVYHRIQRPFRTFLHVFIGAAVAISAAILTASLQLDRAAAIGEPTAVGVEVSDAGRSQLRAAVGCSDPSASSFLAVGGTWDRPELAVDGPGCVFGATWRPDPAHIELRLPAAS